LSRNNTNDGLEEEDGQALVIVIINQEENNGEEDYIKRLFTGVALEVVIAVKVEVNQIMFVEYNDKPQ
jgi:hypothetical protein